MGNVAERRTIHSVVDALFPLFSLCTSVHELEMCIMEYLRRGRPCDAGFAAHIGLLVVLCLRPALGAANPLGQHVRRQSDSGGTVSPKVWVSA